MDIQPGVIEWLLNSDPALKWQVMQDVIHAKESTCTKERARLVHMGWCAQLLKLQDEDGLWNHSL